MTCWFRAYSRDALLKLSLIESFTYTQEVIIDAIGKKIKLVWVPVPVKYFSERKSRVISSIFIYAWRSMKIVVRTVRDTRPTVFFGLPWLISTVIWSIFLLIFIILYLQNFRTTPYNTFYNVGVFFFSLWILLMIFWALADMMRNQRKITESNMYMLRKMFYDKK